MGKDEVEKLKKCAVSGQDLLDRAMQRYYWDEQEELNRRSKDEEQQAEKEQMQMIDWHEFVVVETIEFTAEDNNIPLTAPIDVSTGAPQGAPVPLDGAAGTVFQEARIEKPKGVEEDENEEAQLQLEKEREERERKAAEERERLNEEERKIAEEKEKEEREREEREREEREREELLMPDEEPAELEPEVPMPSQDAEMKV